MPTELVLLSVLTMDISVTGSTGLVTAENFNGSIGAGETLVVQERLAGGG